MKKRGFTALLLVLSLVLGLMPIAWAVEKEDLVVNQENEKYGVVDKTGKVILPTVYDYLTIEENGTIRVFLYGEEEGLGLFSWEGKEILPVAYSYLRVQEDGNVEVGKKAAEENGEAWVKCGLIDPQGKELLPMIYDSIDDLSEGRRRVYLNGKAGYLDEDFRPVIPCQYDYALWFEHGLAQVGCGDGLYGVIDREGKEILPCAYNDIRIYEDGIIAAGLYHSGGARYGLFDREGKEILPMEYDEIRTVESIYGSNFGEYFVVVKDTETERLCGVVDREGKEMVPMVYSYISRPAEDCWIVSQGEKIGALDGNFQMMLPLTDYENVYYHDGAFEVRRNEKWGVIDRSGKTLIPLVYDGLQSEAREGQKPYCRVEKDGKCGILSYPDGKVLLPVSYDRLTTADELTTACKDGKWGVLRTGTWETVVPLEFDRAEIWTYDMGGNLMVVKDGLYGAYDKAGNVVFPCRFPTEERLRGAVKAGSSDPAAVEPGSEAAGLEVTWYPGAAYLIRRYGTDRMLLVQDGKSGLFGLDGTKYTDFIFDAVGEFDPYGQAPAAQNGKWGKIDLDGNTLIDFICDNEQEVELGVKFVGRWEKDAPPYALVKTDGTRLTGYKYWAVMPFSGGLARVADGTNWTYLTPEGTEIFPLGRYSKVGEDFGEVNDGYVIVENRKSGEGSTCNVIDKTGRELFPAVAREIWRAGEGMWGYRDRETGKVGFFDQSTGEIAIPAQYDCYISRTGKVAQMMGNRFYDGRATVYQRTDEENWQWEHFSIDTKGNRVEEPPETTPAVRAVEYPEGLRKVSRNDGFSGPGEGTYGFVNEAGELVVPFLYDDVGDFDHDYASVRKNGVYGLLKNPMIAVEREKALGELDILWLDGAEGELNPLGSDQLVTDYVIRGYGRWQAPYGDQGLWSVEGEHLLTADQAGAAGCYPQGPSSARIYMISEEKIDSGDWEDTRYTDILGRTYLESELWDWGAPWNPPELDCSRAVNPETNRIEEGKYFYADPWTGEIVLPAIYDEAASFSDGIGIVAIGGDRFAIDRTGARLFDLNGYEVGYPWFQEGRLQVWDKQTGKQGFLDKTGEPIGEGLVWDYDGGNVWFHEGATAVSKNGRWGIIDLEGNELIPCVFDDISGFVDGIATVALNGRQGILRDPRYKDRVSDWAQTEVAAATAGGYVTESCREYQTFTITRRQFAELAVNYLEKTTGEAIAPAPADTFTDTADEAVLKAYAAGIVQGVGEGRFSPGGLLTREQLSAMLWRAMSKAGATVETPADLSVYADGGEVSSWAQESLSALVGLEVMAGTGESRLSPKESCTVEQALLLVYRGTK